MSAVALILGLSASASGQTTDQPAQIVSLCEILEDPKAYDGKKVELRGKISSEFRRFFSVYDESYSSKETNGVWLMFGGDADRPTSSTVNDVGRKGSMSLSGAVS
jgi:hypothetical protein